MSAWTWILIGLSGVGLLLALGSVVPVIRNALQLKSHVHALQNSDLLMSFESLHMQANRLSRCQADAQILLRRAAAVRSRLQQALPESGLTQAGSVAGEAFEQVHALLSDLK